MYTSLLPTMKKKAATEEEQEVEILKAVAQAWHGRSGNTRPITEFQTYKNNYKLKPTRFKIEAMKKKMSKEVLSSRSSGNNWDFGQSLWDSYEIVTLAKKLEAGMVLDHPLDGSEGRQVSKRRKESRHSLRSLLSLGNSKRF